MFFRSAAFAAVLASVILLAYFADDADSLEAGSFEEGVHSAHGGERFDPRDGAEFTGSFHKGGADSGTTIRGMQDDSLQEPKLIVQGGHGDAVSRMGESKELRTQ